jgi:hypothetical protein
LDRTGTLTIVVHNFEGYTGFFGRILDDSIRLFRLDVSGQSAMEFPNNSVLTGDASVYIAQRDDGRFFMSNGGSCGLDLREYDQPRSAALLVEYEHRGRYFVTAEGPESALLDADTAQERLRRTGRTFGGWLSTAGLPGSLPVCRFYGDAVAGPRGHFYSLQGSECDLVRGDDMRLPIGARTWRYEGVGFNEAPAGARGSCAQNLQPVHRLFNDGPRRGIDPNHRYAADPAVIGEMQAQGWILEGVAFCAPPATQ